MGQEKTRMLEDQSAPYRTKKTMHVCSDCFSDPYIQEFIKKHEQQEVCDYCDSETEESEYRAAPTNLVLEYIEHCVPTKYRDAEDVRMSSDSRGMEAEELVAELDILSDIDGGFRDELELLFGKDDCNKWLPENYYNENTMCEIFVKSWSQFKNLVKRRSRFVFSQIKRDTSDMDHWEELIDPYSILQWIHGMVSEFGLISELPKESNLYRVRPDSKEYFTGMNDVGTAPIRTATCANRMSPAGIPMFYASDHEKTAIKEVWNGKIGIKFSIGRFKTKQSCQILDLCNLPPIPSIFKEGATLDQIDALSFLRQFQTDICQPVAKSKTEHIDYVPTQIMTEYFRHIYRTSDNQSLMGISYPSAHTGKACYVMFWGHEEDKDINPNVLKNWCSNPVMNRKETISGTNYSLPLASGKIQLKENGTQATQVTDETDEKKNMSPPSHKSHPITYDTFRSFENRPPETRANIAICLIHQTNYLLDQQLRKLEQDFLAEGGLRERMYKARVDARKNPNP